MASETTVVVLSAGQSPFLMDVLTALTRCRPAPGRILMIWSGRAAPPPVPATVETLVIPPESFDHGGTRQLALDMCATPYLAFLSDDAVPVDDQWLGAMSGAFEDARVAITFGRQLARPDASVSERVFRARRYPATSQEFDAGSLQAADPFNLPISNANAAYRAEAARAVGGFPAHCSFGEDMIMTTAVTGAGWKVRYVAEAAAWHSHALSWYTTFLRGLRAGNLLPVQRTISPRRRRFGRSLQIIAQMLGSGWREGGLKGGLAILSDVGARVVGYALGRLSSLVRGHTTVRG